MFPLRLLVSFLESPSASPGWTHTEKRKQISYEKLAIVESVTATHCFQTWILQ